MSSPEKEPVPTRPGIEVEPRVEYRVMARMIREMYVAFLAQGFTAQESLYLTSLTLKGKD